MASDYDEDRERPPGPTRPGELTRAFVVELTAFSGPLDLLLTLLREEQVDINDIPVARIAEQFLVRIRTLRLNDAAEYLEMAARLIRIKAQMLLPRGDAETWEDPRGGAGAPTARIPTDARGGRPARAPRRGTTQSGLLGPTCPRLPCSPALPALRLWRLLWWSTGCASTPCSSRRFMRSFRARSTCPCRSR